jgi:hypothetical protein
MEQEWILILRFKLKKILYKFPGSIFPGEESNSIFSFPILFFDQLVILQ